MVCVIVPIPFHFGASYFQQSQPPKPQGRSALYRLCNGHAVLEFTDIRKVGDPGEVYLQGLAVPSLLTQRIGGTAMEPGVWWQRRVLQG